MKTEILITGELIKLTIILIILSIAVYPFLNIQGILLFNLLGIIAYIIGAAIQILFYTWLL